MKRAPQSGAATEWDEEEEWHANEFLRVRQEMLSAWRCWVQCDPDREDVAQTLLGTWRDMALESGLEPPELKAVVADVCV